MSNIIPMQCSFAMPLDLVNGGQEYIDTLLDLEILEESIKLSGIEPMFMKYFLDRAEANSKKPLTHNKIIKAQNDGILSLRISLLRKKLSIGYRPFSLYLAMSPIYQRFCKIDQWSMPNIPSPSRLNVLENSLSEEFLKEVNAATNQNLLFSKESCEAFDIEEFNINHLYIDSTCMKSNIHYPVDWVLFRDMIRTSGLKLEMIRDGGIKIRMPQLPSKYLTDINKLCMKMHAAYNHKDASKNRKYIFRKMKTLLKTFMTHVQSHLEVFEETWSSHDFSTKKALSIISCLKKMLEKQEDVISVAHRRIINEKFVCREDKILSIYENEVHIIKRGKHDVNVEFGNTAQIIEQEDGFIVGYDLLEEYSPGDSKLGISGLKDIQKKYGFKDVMTVGGDRGYDSKAFDKFINKQNELENVNIHNCITSKSVPELIEKMKDEKYKESQKRRASTEAKVAHVKVIAQNPMKQKGIRNKQVHFGIAILTHNLFKFTKICREVAKNKQEELVA